MSEQAVKPLGEVVLTKVRLAFPDLWTPTSMKPDQPKQFGATFLIEKGSKNEKLVRDAVAAVTKEKWKKDAEEEFDAIKDNPQACAFINGDSIKKRKLDGYAGHMALTAKNKTRPTVARTENGRPVAITEADGIVYAGCYVNAKVEIWAQDNEHGRALRCSLLAVMYHSKGDAFGGGRVASLDEIGDLTVDEEDEAEAMGV